MSLPNCRHHARPCRRVGGLHYSTELRCYHDSSESRQHTHKYDIVGTYCNAGVAVHGVTAEGGKSDDHARSLGDMLVRACPHAAARLWEPYVISSNGQ